MGLQESTRNAGTMPLELPDREHPRTVTRWQRSLKRRVLAAQTAPVLVMRPGVEVDTSYRTLYPGCFCSAKQREPRVISDTVGGGGALVAKDVVFWNITKP